MLACSQDLYDKKADSSPLSSPSHVQQSGFQKHAHAIANHAVISPSAALLATLPSPSLASSHQPVKDQKKPRQYNKKDMNHSSQHGKDKEEQVWPPDVEGAFVEALESIPKLGRRKILVNGKPCGRNELISDFIVRKTGKIRTRKQVSSHIQVLKNTRKGDPHFMRLLTDAVDTEEETTANLLSRSKSTKSKYARVMGNSTGASNPAVMANAQCHPSQPFLMANAGKMNTMQSLESISSCEDSSLSSTSSPAKADYVFDMMYGNMGDMQQSAFPATSIDLRDIYDSLQHPLFNDYLQTPMSYPSSSGANDMAASLMDTNTFGILDFDHTFPNNTPSDPTLFPNTSHGLAMTPGEDGKLLPAMRTASQPTLSYSSSSSSSSLSSNSSKKRCKKRATLPTLAGMPVDGMRDCALPTGDVNLSIKESDGVSFPLWPNYICLYLEYSLPYDPTSTVSHNMALLQHCYPNCLSTVPVAAIDKEKCPPIADIVNNSSGVVLLAKAKLDLNLNISDFVFNNTCFFESRERRVIVCTTTIYSFGNVVLQSEETQQALWLNDGKYMYSFIYVNQFFDAFMKGIRSLQSWEEVDIAIQNLCIIQTFEEHREKCKGTDQANDMQDVQNTSSQPLLCMVYEFERGHGSIDVSAVGDAKTTEKLGIGRGFDFLGDM